MTSSLGLDTWWIHLKPWSVGRCPQRLCLNNSHRALRVHNSWLSVLNPLYLSLTGSLSNLACLSVLEPQLPPPPYNPGGWGSLGLGWAVSLTHFSLVCLCTSLLSKPNLQLSPRAPVTSLSNSYLLYNVLAIISRHLHLIALIRSSAFWVHIFWSPHHFNDRLKRANSSFFSQVLPSIFMLCY